MEIRTLRYPARLILLATFCLVTAAAAQPTVYIDPDTTVVDESVPDFEVALMIDGVIDTFSNFQVVIQFDPSVVSFVESLEGSLYTSSGHQTFPGENEQSPGVWEIFQVIFPFDAYVRAPGELARIKFAPVASGTTSISFTSVVVTDIDRVAIPGAAGTGGFVQVTTSVGVGLPGEESRLWLGQPYPNPSARSASLRMAVPPDAARDARMAVYDVRGRLIRDFTDTVLSANRTIFWDGRDGRGAAAPSGIYFFKLDTRKGTVSRKLILVR
jgi:hypothetical protein